MATTKTRKEWKKKYSLNVSQTFLDHNRFPQRPMILWNIAGVKHYFRKFIAACSPSG